MPFLIVDFRGDKQNNDHVESWFKDRHDIVVLPGLGCSQTLNSKESQIYYMDEIIPETLVEMALACDATVRSTWDTLFNLANSNRGYFTVNGNWWWNENFDEADIVRRAKIKWSVWCAHQALQEQVNFDQAV